MIDKEPKRKEWIYDEMKIIKYVAGISIGVILPAMLWIMWYVIQ